jgi:uncharacterized membrane protein YhhN
MRYRYFNIFFLFIIIFNLIAIDYIPDYRIVSKPLIMAALLGLYISKVNHQRNTFITAMIFALLGDAFLMFTSDAFFIIGLGCFLIMQLLYATVFYADRTESVQKLIRNSLIMLLAAGTILFFLWSDLGSMKLPVLFYTVAISLMVITACSRHNAIADRNTVIAGVILFIISDSLLATGKFIGAFAFQHYLVMLTYMAAQYLIVTGIISSHETEIS